MVHPLLRVIATQPHLLFDHVEAYADLLSEDVGRAASSWKRRAVLLAIAAGSGAVGIVFAGIAVMLWGVIPPEDIHAPWTLLAVPLVPLLLAVICVVVAKNDEATDQFDNLRQQLKDDINMLREVGAP